MHNEIDLNNLTAVVLAGGQGKRMQGQNKGLILFRNQPLVACVLSRLAPQVTNIYISANDAIQSYAQLGYPVIVDSIPGYPGPLAGMYSALYEMQTDWLLTVPCDTPMLPEDYANRMLKSAALNRHHKAFVAHDGERLQSGFCLLHKSLQAQFQHALSSKQFTVHRLLSELDVITVDFSDKPDCFINLNTPEQLEKLQSYDHAN